MVVEHGTNNTDLSLKRWKADQPKVKPLCLSNWTEAISLDYWLKLQILSVKYIQQKISKYSKV